MKDHKSSVLESSNHRPVDEFVRHAGDHVQEMLKAGASRAEILTRLVTFGERVAGTEASVSILVLDRDGLLRNGASPNLPTDYLNAIDRLKPDATVGTCAAAAATGSIVITPDFLSDDKWAELRHLPTSLGFVGAWSMPIKSPEGGPVLGTFGTYFRRRRSPTPYEQKAVAFLADAAALVLVKNSFTD